MSRPSLLISITVLAAFVALLFGNSMPTQAQVPDPEWRSKVDPSLLETLRSAESAEFIVIMDDQLSLDAIPTFNIKEAKARYVFEALTAHAEQSQTEVRALLDSQGAVWRNLWISNALVVSGTMESIQRSAELKTVAYIAANPRVFSPPPQDEATTNRASPATWGIMRINADDVWTTLSITGTGAVVGGQDTGYAWEHPALKPQYRGWDGTTADHNYNWHDSIRTINPLNTGSNPCGLDSPFPCDDGNHGSHTMGTMVGNDDGGISVGVAPGAEWIGCRNMERGWGQPSTYIECFEWFLAPTDLTGTNPDPDKAPHVINNSWHCPDVEGCSLVLTPTINAIETAIDNLRASGVVVVTAASNNGNSCGTVQTPPAMFNNSFAVGSMTSSGAISSFSSFGPVTVNGSNLMKPDITAPGSAVYSTNAVGYGTSSGTSMAAPHIAGVVALMISAKPELAGDVDTIETILRETAVARLPTTLCGDDSAESVPNNVFGAGEVDALAAVLAAQQVTTVVTNVQNSTANFQSGATHLLLILLSLLAVSTITLIRSQRRLPEC